MSIAPVNSTFQNGISQVSGPELNTFVQYVQTIAQLRNFNPFLGPQHIYLEGVTTPGDGGSGDFYWDGSSTGPDDGANVIVPNGVSVGAWIRQGGSGIGAAILCTADLNGTVITLTPINGQSSVSNPPLDGQLFVFNFYFTATGPFTLGVNAQTPALLYDGPVPISGGFTASLTQNQTCIVAWQGPNSLFLLINPAASSQGAVPVGGMLDWTPGTVPPTGYIWCYGQPILRGSFPQLNTLFAAAGYPYGGGDGSTTFNLPDCRGRVVAGRDDMGGTVAGRLTASTAQGVAGSPVGSVGGEQAHSLVINENAQHTHTVSQLAGMGNGGDNSQRVLNGSFTTTVSTGPSGLGTGHNNVQPTIICDKIIRVG